MDLQKPQNQDELDEEEELFDLKKIFIEPECSAIADEVKFVLEFQVKKPLTNVNWKVKYILDSTGKRLILNLLETKDGYSYSDTTQLHSITLQTPKIEVEKVPRKTLLNVGLLNIEAFNDQKTLLNINMVVHVGPYKDDVNALNKTVLNPLE